SLEIEDGSHKVLNELTPQQLRAGSLTYTRSTGNVLARLTVHGANQTTLTQMARFLGPPVTVTAVAAPVAPVPVAPAVPAAPDPNVGSAERLSPPPAERPVERKALVRAEPPPRLAPPEPAPAPTR